MRVILLGFALGAALLSGCASVPMASGEASSQAKLFKPPSQGQAGLYIYRDSSFGGALKKDIWVDGRCVGESAPDVFFYEEVAGDQEHTISTESEFSPNALKLQTARNRNYFIRQYIKLGLFVGGANLEVVDDAEGREDVSELELAKGGTCSQADLAPEAAAPRRAKAVPAAVTAPQPGERLEELDYQPLPESEQPAARQMQEAEPAARAEEPAAQPGRPTARSAYGDSAIGERLEALEQRRIKGEISGEEYLAERRRIIEGQ